MNTSFRFVYDKARIEKASNYISSFDRDNFLNLLVDVYTLSEAEFFVGTFTSNVGRFAFELMQSYRRKMDNSIRVKSLDRHFYFHGFHALRKKAILDHKPNNYFRSYVDKEEIELKVGDILWFYPIENSVYKQYSALWDGDFFGKNQRTNRKGSFPSYKVKDLYA